MGLVGSDMKTGEKNIRDVFFNLAVRMVCHGDGTYGVVSVEIKHIGKRA